jgi:hypothetical protein
MTNESDSDKAEDLLQQAKAQKRHTTDPSTGSSEDSAEQSLETAVIHAYERLDSGDLHENLTLRDADLAALMAGLEETGHLEEVGERAASRLNRDESADSRASVLKLLVRIGLSEVAVEEVAAAKDGKKEFLVSQVDDF